MPARTLLLSAVLAGAHALAAAAQALPTTDPAAVGMSVERLARIDAAFQAEIDKGALPGAVIMVARDGQLAHVAALGAQNPAGNAPMGEDGVFRIYSMTKPLVSVAAMILMEEAKLQLTDPVSKFLPEFASTPVSVASANVYGTVSYATVPAARQMTVQDLLRHTSGLAYGELTGNAAVKAAYAEGGLFNPGGMAFDARSVEPAAQVAALAKAPLVHQPGTVWEYSLASDLLGRVVEAASGQRLGDFLEARVFAPLGMDDTGFFVDEDEAMRLVEPGVDPATGQPYAMIDVSQQPANDSGGAGAVSTAGDYLRFTQMLLNGGALDGTRILSPTSVKLMTSDHLGDRIAQPVEPGELLMGVPGYSFGLGFMVREQDGVAGVPGSQGEFMWAGYGGTFFWADPEERIAAVLMTQQPGATRAYYRRMIKQLVHQAVVDETPAMAN
ncbi:serine hydrolase domain-containing protein [Rubrimonas cliftonensis]|uniref:CubicO group peptidase, beta-lactamase class C family n=1 Tax=Rubrimonas cliftonensis TaxID=89524 RepID=A0A1H3VME1_9RHOB|nr:serine hydrolase domain-containing protein [Rubrimonas cliftonensis]SDZ75278.1 CubicO group peptidase, beta-lactamase class C family [Rubrimonas cliftonensis]